MDSEEVWNRTLDTLKDQVGQQTVELWFKPIKLIALNDQVAVLEVPNRFFQDWLEENYLALLSSTLGSFYKQSDVTVKFTVTEKPTKKQAQQEKQKIKKEGPRKLRSGVALNPKYTFENFVVGESNRFAQAASMAVSENPGRKYNPLFIYGGVGLGKTHLIHAIGNYLLNKHRDINLMYMPTNQFMNEYIYAVRSGKITDFKKRNSELDVLLIDDVQFIAGKESTQDELFHTFNILYGLQRQIVFSSDRPPKEISSITERLRSRFGMGLISDIEPPDVETQVAILWKKSEAEGIMLPENVVMYLAQKIKSNIRDLESCLIRLGAHSSLSGRPITLDMARSVLKDVIVDEDKPLNPPTIQKIVSEHFGVKIQDIKSKKRTKEVVIPRQISMYLCKRLTDYSLSDIGKDFGGKDHSTVIHACKQVEQRIKKDEDFHRKVQYLIEKIKS